MDGCWSQVKDCLQQSTKLHPPQKNDQSFTSLLYFLRLRFGKLGVGLCKVTYLKQTKRLNKYYLIRQYMSILLLIKGLNNFASINLANYKFFLPSLYHLFALAPQCQGASIICKSLLLACGLALLIAIDALPVLGGL